MAKKKVQELKNSSFINKGEKKLEDKLQKALIPVNKQHYKIPQNWRWVRLGSVINLYRGISYGKNDVHKQKEKDDILILRGGNLREGYIKTQTGTDNVYVNKHFVNSVQIVKKHDVLIVSSTGSSTVIGKAGISHIDYQDVSFGAFLILARPKDQFNKSYIDYFFLTDIYRHRIRLLANGTNINNVRFEHINETTFPLPPLAEQERIANKLDNYISKLDEAKEKLKKVVDTYNYRKNLILHRAFTGQLTKKWRKENKFELDDDIKKQAITKDSMLPDKHLYEIPENWCWVRLNDTISISKETTDDFLDKTIKYIGLENIEKNGGINSVGDISEVKSLKNVFHKGQILYGKLRPYLNKHDIANFEGVCSTDILVLDSNRNTINTFVNYYLSNIYFIDYVVYNSRGTNLPRITTKILLNASFPLPPLEEQKEIVKILDSILSKEKQVKEIAEKEIERVEDLKKNLLIRAFGGVLGTNDPNEENSIELLKTVL